MTEQQKKKPLEAWGIFSRHIDQSAVQAVFSAFHVMKQNNIERLHLLFQSNGGVSGESICLYNFFKTCPIDLTIYNVGSIHSGGVLAYLGAKKRVCSSNSTFMLHRSAGGLHTTAERLQSVVDSLLMDDTHLGNILRESSKLPKVFWDQLERCDVYFNSKQAIEWGIADSIGDFAPASGAPFFNV